MIQEALTETNTEREAELLKILDHPVRLKIIDLLSQHRELNVQSIRKQTAISQSLVCYHLIKMNDKGILISVRRSREIYYSLADPILADLLTLSLKVHK